MLKLRHPLSLLAIFILVMLGVLRTFGTPAPLGADVPDVQFSAIRAEAILRDLIRENQPHPSGSELNAFVRNRLLAHLHDAGYEPEIQSRFHCNPQFGSCATVDNVVAVKPGKTGKNALLLTAHYDSGWTGPGAADDGAGMAAIVEIARMAADFPPFENDIIFLITDAEEVGLIGAHAFAEYHPLFDKVKTVINLEARGATGPSAMFETGEGNRSVIRVFAKNAERPVANSLAYEVYKRMPNDTDYSVYRDRGVMGLNFAFTGGVPVYHSRIDDLNHLDLGSLQHHGDNAWAMVKALGDRNLAKITAREDAGFIDVFGLGLVHYPVAITAGLALVLGVWVMLAIGLAFRQEFRFRQLSWGFVAIPFFVLTIILGAYLLSWPLGRWPDLHALEHPYPWAGRVALFLLVGLAGFTTLKLFTGRVSACAWMVLAWALIFLMAMVLANKLPTATHLALIPLALFSLGSVVDLFRKKSPAPLLFASVSGFAAAAFISLSHFFMLDVVMNFDLAHVKAATLVLAAMTAMPMLLAWVSKRELTWRPAKWLGVAILAVCVVHWFLPAYSPERPRGMTLMYSESGEGDTGHIVLESLYRDHDKRYAKSHSFAMTSLNTGRLEPVERPAREVKALGLAGIVRVSQQAEPEGEAWRHRLEFELPVDTPLLKFTLPLDSGLQSAWINGELALDTSIKSKSPRSVYTLGLVHPNQGTVRLELLTSSPGPFKLAAVSWHELPGVLVAPFLGTWPDDAQPLQYGPRAEKLQEFEVGAAAGLSSEP